MIYRADDHRPASSLVVSASPSLLASIAAVFLLAGFVKGVVGMGLPTVAVGLLAVTMPPAEAASLLVVPSFVTNVWQLMIGRAFLPLLRRLWTMMAAIVVGTVAAAGLMTGGGAHDAVIGLALALIAYAMLGLTAVRFHVPARHEPWLSPVIGLATGVMTGATGVFVVPGVPYTQALGFDKDDLIQALGLSFTVSTIALAIGLWRENALHAASVTRSGLALLPALGGMFIGQKVRDRMSPAVFRRVFFIGLLGLGIYLLVETLV